MHGDPHIVEILKKNKLLVVPVINVDGYRYISEMYAKTGTLVYKRKNQNLAY